MNQNPLESGLVPAPPIAESSIQGGATAAERVAEIQAAVFISRQFPRNWDQARADLLRECQRPAFARDAFYFKPVGEGIRGPSIRFVETAIRCLTNVHTKTKLVSDDEEKRVIDVSVIDYEANVSHGFTVTIDKTIERHAPAGREVLRTRQNKSGRTVYICKADEDSLLNKQGALVSKAIRTAGLRLIPGDLIDEADAVITRTIQQETIRDPEAARHKMLDAFQRIGVQPNDLKEYLGHDVARCSPEQIETLRGIHSAIKDRQTTWSAVMEHQRESMSPQAPPTDPKTQKHAEILAIGEAIAAATTPVELAAITERIAKLPERDREEMKAAWTERQAEVDG